ncbi:zinc finger protein 675 [Eurytemora carolleeae]|uniref:zinc finger protein 675 n=1 Tax=Eurytemora carolleeae TaxID=1294199 RepID=UPI000C77A9B1|nr:zinc finger protein 675 [Eurytemora carolleeae]|eukprot:XP_023328396.1 zinc finger protein 675-like [Eurytemora affinis]
MCTKGFSSFHALKSHQKTHLNVDPDMMIDPKTMVSSMQVAFSCRFCGENIMYGKHLDEHIRTTHQADLELGEKAYTCQICEQMTDSENMDPAENQKPGVAFDEFYHFETHLRMHGINVDNICRFCRKTNYNRNKFVQHFKDEHPGEVPYECPRYGCEKMFTRKQKQQDHITLHRVRDGDVPEDMKKLCMECGKVFYIRKKLEQHVRLMHGGVGLPDNILQTASKSRKHQCHLCVKTFSNNSLLQAHLRKHDNNPSFVCDHCGKGFYRKDRLAVHTRSVHLGMKNFACDLCEKKFIDSYKLRRHLKTHTSGRNQPQAVVATSVEVTSTPTVTSYAMIQGGTRKEQTVTIHGIGSGGPTIIQLSDQAPVAKRTTVQAVQNFLKFENEEEVLEVEQRPVDFTQQGDNKIQQYIINTQLYHT